MGSNGCFTVCCSNSWKTSRIENWNGIWKKTWPQNGFVGL